MRTGRPKAELVLSDSERAQLLSFARSRSLPAALSNRARIILSSADGEPNNAIALNNLAYRKAEEGQDLDEALRMAQHARQIQPNATAMADTLGWIYIKKNMSGEAERIFKDLVDKDPNNPMFHYHYGMALMQKGDKSSAKREFEVALKNKPSKDDAGKIQDLLNKL